VHCERARINPAGLTLETDRAEALSKLASVRVKGADKHRKKKPSPRSKSSPGDHGKATQSRSEQASEGKAQGAKKRAKGGKEAIEATGKSSSRTRGKSATQATGVGTDETALKRLKLACVLSEFGKKIKKKEEPVSSGFQVGSERFRCTMAATGELIGQVLRQVHNDKPGHAKPIENHLRLKKTAMEALETDAVFHKREEGDDGARWAEERTSNKAGKTAWSVWAICMWVPGEEEKNSLKESASFEWAEKIIRALNKRGKSQKLNFPTSRAHR
jgi:hypothetical protein